MSSVFLRTAWLVVEAAVFLAIAHCCAGSCGHYPPRSVSCFSSPTTVSARRLRSVLPAAAGSVIPEAARRTKRRLDAPTPNQGRATHLPASGPQLAREVFGGRAEEERPVRETLFSASSPGCGQRARDRAYYEKVDSCRPEAAGCGQCDGAAAGAAHADAGEEQRRRNVLAAGDLYRQTADAIEASLQQASARHARKRRRLAERNLSGNDNAKSADDNAKSAERNLLEVIRLDPEHIRAHYQLGELYFRCMGKPSGARRELNQCLRVDPTNVACHVSLAELELSQQGVPGLDAAERLLRSAAAERGQAGAEGDRADRAVAESLLGRLREVRASPAVQAAARAPAPAPALPKGAIRKACRPPPQRPEACGCRSSRQFRPVEADPHKENAVTTTKTHSPRSAPAAMRPLISPLSRDFVQRQEQQRAAGQSARALALVLSQLHLRPESNDGLRSGADLWVLK